MVELRGREPAARLGREKILVVEDDPGVAVLQRRHLERAGYGVVGVATAEDALDRVDEGDVKLIVLDHGLPDATGLEFYERLRASGHDLPVIMVTGLSDPATVIEALRAGLRDFVTKTPEYLDYLPGAVERVLTQVRLEQLLEESEERFRGLVENLQVGVILIGARSEVLLANQASLDLLGLREDRLVGTNLLDAEWDVVREDGSPLSLHELPALQAITERRPVRNVTMGIRCPASGAQVWLLANADPQLAPDGSVRQVICTFNDITERKRAEELIQRQAELLEQTHDAVFMWKHGGEIVYWNQGAERLYGWSKEEALGLISHELLGTVHPFPLEELDLMLRRDGYWEGELIHHDRDGQRILVESRHVLTRQGPEAEHVLETNRNITERRRVEEALQARVRQQAAVAKLGQQALESRNFSELMNAAVALVAQTLEVEHCKVLELLPGGDNLLLRAHVGGKEGYSGHATLASGKESQAGYTLLSREPVIVEDLREETRFSPSLLPHEQDVVSGVSVIIQPQAGPFGVLGAHTTRRRTFTQDDVNFLQAIANAIATAIERERAEEQLHYGAFHDPLTGLPNRRLFMDRLGQALKRTDRKGSNIAILFLDLDNFKVINDSLGHEAGDCLLVQVGRRMRATLRCEDTLARLGGDEFAILLEGVTSPNDVVGLAQRIAQEFREPSVVDGRKVFTAISVGIAIGASGRERPEELLRNADVAMYRAKEKDGTGYQLFDPSMHVQMLRRLDLENELRRAIEQDELTVHYQPRVCLETGAVFGFEALVRWEHPGHGLMPPIDFIPLAEETGLIVHVGRWVLREACRQTREWQKLRPSCRDLSVSVNLSPKQFHQPDLIEDLTQILRDTELDPCHLELEITESAVAQEPGIAKRTLQKLKDLGVRIAVDDFGTGYSSLSRLKYLPIDTLKIDRSFVSTLGEDAEDEVLISAMLSLGTGLSLEVVAEGVETPLQAAHLRNLGCTRAQGYLFSRPLTSEATRTLLPSGARG